MKKLNEETRPKEPLIGHRFLSPDEVIKEGDLSATTYSYGYWDGRWAEPMPGRVGQTVEQYSQDAGIERVVIRRLSQEDWSAT